MNRHRKIVLSQNTEDVYDPKVFFTPEFNSQINRLVIEMSRTQGKLMKAVPFGPIKSAIVQRFHQFFPQSFLDMRIIFCTNVNGRYLTTAAIGTLKDTGERVVVYNPDQARSERVRTLVHESKHEMDFLKGKKLDQTGKDPKELYRSPEERRSRRYEETFGRMVDKAMQKKNELV